MELIIDIFSLVGSLALFLFGMKTMSEGLEKFAGDRLRSILAAMTKNCVMGVLTGILITALIQSSSATTVMVVSFVNAGLMTLGQSIGVIMGANIGTTVTASINIEHEINNYRTQLKNQNLHDVNSGLYGYQLGVFYVDFISECEKLADYVMNVVQAGKGLNNDYEDRPRNGQG